MMRAYGSAFSCLIVSLAVMPMTARAGVALPAGTQVINTATATYTSAGAVQYAVASNTVITLVAAVSAVGLAPNETGCKAATDAVDATMPFGRTFVVTNASNVRDAYVVTATASAGTIQSIVATAANGTRSSVASGAMLPPLEPGQTASVAIVATAKTVALGTSITIALTVRSSVANAVNGEASATAAQCAITAGPAAFGGTSGTAIPKLVDNVIAEAKMPGARLAYTVAFRNTGGVIAHDTVFTDPLPPGIVAQPGSATIDGSTVPATFVRGTLTILVGDVAPGASLTIAFSALIDDNVAFGTSLVNVASLAASNVPNLETNPAAVLAGIDNIVYDGYGGPSEPVNDAVVTLVNDQTGQPLPPVAGTPKNAAAARREPSAAAAGSAAGQSTSKSTTPINGAYVFEVAMTGAARTVDLDVTAPGYRNRRIKLTLTPDASDTLYSATLTALDGQLLAHPGDFELEPGPVTTSNVYGIFGNLPLFRTSVLTVSKTVDRQVASPGDRLFYTLTFANVSVPLGLTAVVDTLPPGTAYAPHTARLDGQPLEPAQNGPRLTWTLKTLTTSHTITLATIISPGVSENTTLTNLVSVASGTVTTVAGAITGSATALTTIIAGLFSDRTVLTGRVYVDAADAGTFRRGDVGVATVRLFLESGESVVTDTEGRFSFPGVKPGLHVLRLDATTLPAHVRPFADRAYDSERSTRRLIHGVFDGGVMQDVNFALRSAP